MITITLIQAATILANANQNQVTNMKILIIEKCHKNNNNKNNYNTATINMSKVFWNGFKLIRPCFERYFSHYRVFLILVLSKN